MIAWTEVGRAINTAAIQCYRDYGVTHKHLLLSPNACDLCKEVAEDGDIPLDAPFSAGGVIGQIHVRCRCCPAPSSVSAEPPLADLGKFAAAEDESRAGFLMMRARHPEDGKWRYLLHMRPDGTWGLPGGTAHAGEHSYAAAIRESREEIGELPPLGQPLAVMQHPGDDKTVWIHLHEVPWFQPDLASASTPEETAGAGWFRRKEVSDLDLHPPFRRQWEAADWKNVGKSLQRTVNENGEVSALTEAAQPLSATGSRWPYPHRADGAEWPDAGPGAYPGASPGDEPPNHVNDMAEPEPHDTLEPRGGDDGKMPTRGRKPNPPADAFPNAGDEHDDMWPPPENTLQPPGSSIGARTGVPPSGEKNDSGHPVVGSVPAKTPKPYSPHSIPAQAFDPGEVIEQWSPEAGSDVVHDLGKGASDPHDANPVERPMWPALHGRPTSRAGAPVG